MKPSEIGAMTFNSLTFLVSLMILYKVWVPPSKVASSSLLRKWMYATGWCSCLCQMAAMWYFASRYEQRERDAMDLTTPNARASTFFLLFGFYSQYFFLTMSGIERYRHLKSNTDMKPKWTRSLVALCIGSGFLLCTTLVVQFKGIPYVELGTAATACLWIIFVDSILDIRMISMTLSNLAHQDSRRDSAPASSLHQATPSQEHRPSQTPLTKAERLLKLKHTLYFYYGCLMVSDVVFLLNYLIANVVTSLKPIRDELSQTSIALGVFHTLFSLKLFDMFKQGVTSPTRSSVWKSKTGVFFPRGSSLFKKKDSLKQEPPRLFSHVTELSSIGQPSEMPVESMAHPPPMTESALFKDDSEEDLRRDKKMCMKR